MESTVQDLQFEVQQAIFLSIFQILVFLQSTVQCIPVSVPVSAPAPVKNLLPVSFSVPAIFRFRSITIYKRPGAVRETLSRMPSRWEVQGGQPCPGND